MPVVTVKPLPIVAAPVDSKVAPLIAPLAVTLLRVVSPVTFNVPVTLVFLSAVVPVVTVKPLPIVAAPVDSKVAPLIAPLAVTLLRVVSPVTFNVPPTVALPVVDKISVLTVPVVVKPVVLNVVLGPTLTVFVVASSSTLPTVRLLKTTSSFVATIKSEPLAVTVIFFPAVTSA